MEDGLIALARAEQEEMLQLAERRLQAWTQVEDDMRQRKLELGRRVNKRIVEEMTKIVDAVVRNGLTN